MVKTGLDLLFESDLRQLRGSRIGLIAGPASVNSRLEHAGDLLLNQSQFQVTALFGPQHGFRGETQDNMVEWKSFQDPRTGLPAYSLYGETRKPTPDMLQDVDVLMFDLQDVGTRVYTFIYTMALAMEAARDCDKQFVVLDRPNPIDGIHLDGTILEPEYKSFVGMFPIPMRHGMTVGELALMFNREIQCDIHVIGMEGWRREMWFDQVGLPWVMPSPNMPTLDTATVYPGAVMIEGTEISEGRGTTRPFEIIGAPYIDPYHLVAELRSERLPGMEFRPLHFQPTFNKFAGELCGGLQIHVTDRRLFKPFITGLAIMSAIRRLYPGQFQWKQAPYEYVWDKLPIDVIAGSAAPREAVEAGVSVRNLESTWLPQLEEFNRQRAEFLLYD